MPTDRASVVTFLRGLTLKELREILAETADAWKVSIRVHETCQGCDQIVYGPHACPGREITTFDVTLVDLSSQGNRPAILRLIQEVAGVSLTVAARLLNERPNVVLRGVTKFRAEAVRKQFSQLGVICRLDDGPTVEVNF